MAGALQWSATLKDGMSAPARASAAGLGALADALRTAGAESDRLQRKQEAASRASVGRDAIAKLQARHKAEEGGAQGDLMANMRHHDAVAAGMRNEAAAAAQLAAARSKLQGKDAASDLAANMRHHDIVALEQTRQKAEAAAKAMDKLRAASRASAAYASIAEGKGSFRGGSVGGRSLTGPPPNLSAFTRFLQILNRLGPAGQFAASGILRASGSIGKAGEMASKLSGPLKAVGGALLSVGSMALQAGAAVGAIFVAGGLALARYVTKIQSFKQSTMFAFSSLLGGQAQAVAGWERVKAAAALTGTSLLDTGAAFNSLLGQGFKLDEVDTLFKRMADLKTLNPATNIEGIARAISQIKATGRLQGDELMQLNEAGLSSKLVYEELAKSLGKSVPEIKKLQEAGKITDKQAIDAIQAAIAKQTGGKPAGALAAEATSKTLVGAMGKAVALAQIFVSNLNIDFSPVVRFLERIGKVLSGDAGKRFGKSIEGGFAGVLGLLDNISEKDIAKGFDAASAILEDVASAAKDTASTVKTVDAWLDSIGSKASVVSTIFSGIGNAIVFSMYLVLNPAKAFWGLLQSIYERIMAIVGALQQAGAASSSLTAGGLSLPGIGNANALPPGVTNAATAPAEGSGNALADAIRQLTGGPAQPGAPGAPAPAGAPVVPPPAKTINKTYAFNAVGITDAEFVERVKTIIKQADAEGGDDD